MQGSSLIDLPKSDLRIVRARHEVLRAEEPAAGDLTCVSSVVLVCRDGVRSLMPILSIPVDFKETDGICGASNEEHLAHG